MAKLVDIVFEGGGAKGSVFVGALKAMSERGWGHRRLVGTSAGAITATMVGAGYKVEELEELNNQQTDDGKSVFSTFMDIPAEGTFARDLIDKSLTSRLLQEVDIPGFPDWIQNRIDRLMIQGLMKTRRYRQLFSFIELGGLYSGQTFLRWITEKLDKRDPSLKLGTATLRQFAERTKSDVSLAISDTTTRKIRILNHRTAPDCPIAWAVRMSMSIPFIWQEVEWDARWGKYLGEDMTGHAIVDGGVLSNFPMDYIISDADYVKQVMGDTDPNAAGNLGLLIDETLPVNASGKRVDTEVDASKGGLFTDEASFKVLRRVRRLAGAMLEAHDQTVLAGHEHEVCRLPAKGYGTTEFDMAPERMAALIAAGYSAMIQHIDGRKG